MFQTVNREHRLLVRTAIPQGTRESHHSKAPGSFGRGLALAHSSMARCPWCLFLRLLSQYQNSKTIPSALDYLHARNTALVKEILLVGSEGSVWVDWQDNEQIRKETLRTIAWICSATCNNDDFFVIIKNKSAYHLCEGKTTLDQHLWHQ